jgi:hypothetical protein
MKRVLSEGLLEFDDVFVVESFEYFDFTEDDAFVLLIGIVLFEFFDSDCVMIRNTKVGGLFIFGFEDDTVLALSDSLENFIFIHVNKIILCE